MFIGARVNKKRVMVKPEVLIESTEQRLGIEV